ncbi:MAG: hypothetical protein Q7N87_05070 [Candidatus Uhrbacteria bacterium]|nr:hypothetical protein [Candidatus Uhrbacteria bacterium]
MIRDVMHADAWLFSAKQAWQHLFFRWVAIASLLLVMVGSTYFLWKVVPMRKHHPAFVSHYNVYLGIDQVGSWTWAWILPGVWFLITLLDLVIAYGIYRTDFYLAASLLIVACAWGLPWMGALFYLTLVNA